MENGDKAYTFDDFLRLHEPQLRNSDVPERFWGTAYQKLVSEVWDSASRIELNRVISVDVDDEEENGTPSSPRAFAAEPGISASDPNSIFLIDHAWTFEAPTAREMLLKYKSLLNRMLDIMDVAFPSAEVQELAERVLENMWKFVNTYTFSSPGLEVEQKLPKWYIMDEIGSSIRHSSQPNCRSVPFYHIPEAMTYSLLFPIRDIEAGEEITRNFVESLLFDDPLTYQCRLLPWVPSELPPVGFEPRAVRPEYFGNSKLADSIPLEVATKASDILAQKGQLAVYAEYDVLRNHLSDPRFRLTDQQMEADILWYNRHFSDYRAFSEEMPEKFVNQFPFESVLTVKDLLAIVCRRSVTGSIVDPNTLECRPAWLPLTYNMDTELPSFVNYYKARQQRGLDNLWIIKPWNLARSLDINISSNLNCILRMPETGPKLACKYIEDPVLFQRSDVPEGPVKFDMRFIAMLNSVKPLKCGVYKRFWLRFANKPFSLTDFDIYDKHFTVMNYGQGEIHQMYCDKFIEEFERQYPDQKWNHVEQELYKVVKEVFIAATSKDPPEGIAHSAQSRAVLGFDFMLKWIRNPDGTRRIQPMLLEVNYSPDCKRACDYYPTFYNELFSYLFLDEPVDTIEEL